MLRMQRQHLVVPHTALLLHHSRSTAHSCEWSASAEVLPETAVLCSCLRQCACTASGAPPPDVLQSWFQRGIFLHAGRLRFLGNRSSADTVRADVTTCHSVVDIIDNVLLP